ncbi:hypothetical protein PVK06_009022 [Gossypium arboreum]|uniref:Uncharacterized protein n=1 Tax=Gossypium arboreum TaxID=29729 RepID=A0ABR0QMR4_GOSAR|nr:hypothetical protein PVK06_009022 [Gossypium arboreum]
MFRIQLTNQQKFKEQSSGKKFGCLQLFDITHRKKDGSPMTTEATEIMEKLKDKRAEYEAVASSDSSVNLEDIDNQVIPEVSGPEREAPLKVTLYSGICVKSVAKGHVPQRCL